MCPYTYDIHICIYYIMCSPGVAARWAGAGSVRLTRVPAPAAAAAAQRGRRGLTRPDRKEIEQLFHRVQ